VTGSGTAGQAQSGQDAASAEPIDSLGKFFSPLAAGKRSTMTVETPLYTAELTSLGGGIGYWQMKNYNTWNGRNAAFFNRSEEAALALLFHSSDGKRISTRHLYFTPEFRHGTTKTLAEGESLKVTYTLKVEGAGRPAYIAKTLVFHADSYVVDVYLSFVNMEGVISNFQYNAVWDAGLRYFEHNSIDEASHSKAAAYSGGELLELDATEVGIPYGEALSGKVAWAAMRNKYFVVAMIPKPDASQGAFLSGYREGLKDQGVMEHYSVGIEMPFQGLSSDGDSLRLYLGPLDYDLVTDLDVGLDQIMSLGAAWIIRPISEFFIMPLLMGLHWIIPNYGIVLILFALIMKVILHPLTKKSMESMRKMQALQPMMNELREKYKDDPTKMNQGMMRLYKEYGVNPAGGCLPLLLQMPILYALWSTFSATIELRQAGFVWWIHDLSIPDIIVKLPFSLPIMGAEVSGLAMLMGITMLIQQKMSVKDPRQKAMVYLMPIMMTLLFNSFPSGLNLYYFVFNLLSIVQQSWLNKKHKDEPLRKVDPSKKPGGIIARLSQNLPKAPKR
jgi:YidC/Oxa1 family membrane protein insertase